MPTYQYSRKFLAHMEKEHRPSPLAQYLKEIVYGGNDGIVTTFAVVAGFAGADGGQTAAFGLSTVLLFGLANLFADGASMGLGNYLSTRSENDLYASERQKEHREIVRNPKSEAEESVEMLQAEGYSEEDARALTGLFRKNPKYWTDFMMQYEVQLSPGAEHPLRNALATFAAFLIFGAIPLLPYLLGLGGTGAFQLSIGLSLVALVLLGILRAVITRTKAIRSLTETMAIGVLAGGIAYGVGALFE